MTALTNLVFTTRCVEEAQIELFRPRPPHIRRRGMALHLVCGVSASTPRQSGEVVKLAHRARSAQSYTLYSVIHKATEAIRLLATVTWADSGTSVAVQEIIAEQGLIEETRAKLKALQGPPPRGSPGLSRSA